MNSYSQLNNDHPEISPVDASFQSIDVQKKLVVLVGLPARGKTYTGKRLARYLNWVGIHTKLFNVGEYRRTHQKEEYTSHNFFSPENEDGVSIRNYAANLALEDVSKWLKLENNTVAILDATNSTRERRERIISLSSTGSFGVIFIELICNDEDYIRKNILEVKVDNPDYEKMDETAAVKDFMDRIQHYKSVYEPLSDELDKNLSFAKIINRGEKFILNNIMDNLSTRIIYFLMNLRVFKRTIYITRHGESIHNLHGKIGGNSDLSQRGWLYAKKLTEYFTELNLDDLIVFTSLMNRTKQTARDIPCKSKKAWKILNEIDAGHCDSLTYKEIKKIFPQEYARRNANKYSYRYPMGESYHDLINRIEPVMMSMARDKNLLIVCHQAVARCIIGYFKEYEKEEIPHIKVPLHEIIKLTPTAYGCLSESIKFDMPIIDAEDNHSIEKISKTC